MKFSFPLTITEFNEGYRVAFTVQISKFYPISKYPLCWEWEMISGLKTATGYFLATACYARRVLYHHFVVIDIVSCLFIYLFDYLFSSLTFLCGPTPQRVLG